MPSVAENRAFWGDPAHWSRGGDHWSEDAWGSPHGQWYGSIYPRCFPYLKGRVLEIATGQGRWTQFLKARCDSLIGVDLSELCVQHCRSRFTGEPGLRFEVTDGLTLPMVEDRSIDFAFSFDSLVHADADVLESYVRELARALKPGAVAFIHHSNVGAIRWPILTRVKHRLTRTPIPAGWRSWSMSASLMREFVARSGMSCVQQELIPWLNESELIDSMTTIINVPRGEECVVIRNHRFMEEAAAIKRAVDLVK